MEEEKLFELSVYDLPNETDYDGERFLEVCMGRGEYNRPYEEAKVFNQEDLPACTRYGITHLNNGQNILEYRKSGFKYTQIDPKVVWERCNKDKRLTSALAQLKTEGMIEGYVLLSRSMELQKKLDAFKKAIDLGYYIYTGIEYVKRGPTNQPPYIINVGNTGIGHAFAIIDYDDKTKLFKFMNSFGENRGDHGYNYIRYEDITKLMSAYMIIDKDNSGIFETFKKQTQARNAIIQLKDMWDKLSDAHIRVQIHTLADTIRKEYKINDI